MRITITQREEQPSLFSLICDLVCSALDIALIVLSIIAIYLGGAAGGAGQFNKGTYFIVFAFLCLWMATKDRR